MPQKINLDWAFSTFIGVGTHVPNILQSEIDKYTQRARGKWSFNGTGTIAFAAPVNFTRQPAWTAVGAGVTQDEPFHELPNDGSVVPEWAIPQAPPNTPQMRVLNDALKGWHVVVNGIRTYNSVYHDLINVF